MSDVKLKIPISEDQPKSLIGVRYYQFLLMFITLIICFVMRTVLSVAIISMTAETPPDPSIPTYPEWDNTDVILSSFFWGYILPQVGAGQLSEYFGPKWFLCGTMTIGSVFNIAVPPMAAAFGSTGVIICRVIQGLNQGFLYPSIHNLISQWSPIAERARVSNVVYAGASLGIAIAMPLTGAIAGSELGWPTAFYGIGGAGVAWALIFAIFAENSPTSHKKISKEELMYIQENNAVKHSTTKKVQTPWRSILTSLPMWAILIAACAQCWGAFTLLTEMPSYMDGIMNFDIKSNSLLSAVPYVGHVLTGIAVSPLADKLIINQVFRTTTTRKIFGGLGTFVPALALTWLAFIDGAEQELALVLLVVAVGCTAFVVSGYLINIIDAAPNHAGTILGIVNGTSNICSILGPLTVGLLGSDKSDPILWRKVFLLSAGIYIACGLFYAIFTSADVQRWNGTEKEEEKTEKK
ncbi:putative inorganic phosphate cotransporter [Zophobas morio]|uniref:putative inorganic phosphate cotransporter n=1 Tax=Zophobas morio TaxID=2755281 RepID=UPI003083B165